MDKSALAQAKDARALENLVDMHTSVSADAVAKDGGGQGLADEAILPTELTKRTYVRKLHAVRLDYASELWHDLCDLVGGM